MIISVRAHTQSSRSRVLKDDPAGVYHVYVHAPPEKGRANKEIIKLLSDYFNVPKSAISLTTGEKSRDKKFHIDQPPRYLTMS